MTRLNTIGQIKVKKIRVGRGIGSGKGKTSGRGHKGQKSRSGGSIPRWFEGGQMPLQRRVPKFGFKNINRKEYVPINIDTIQLLIEQKRIKKQLKIKNILELNLAHKGDLIKILGRGKLESPVEVYAHKFSKSAENSIEKAGGKVIKL